MRFLLAVLLFAAVPHLSAQSRRTVFELGSGSFTADDPFLVTLGFRAAIGRILGARDRIAVEYARQRANRSEGHALGLIARDFLAVGWNHSFRNAFSEETLLKQQYLLHMSAGIIPSRKFPEAVGNERLQTAPFLGIGLVIRYPISNHFALLGTLDDAMVFLPRQTVRSYCPPGAGGCYNPGDGFYYDVNVGGAVQQNFAFFVSLQARM